MKFPAKAFIFFRKEILVMNTRLIKFEAVLVKKVMKLIQRRQKAYKALSNHTNR